MITFHVLMAIWFTYSLIIAIKRTKEDQGFLPFSYNFLVFMGLLFGSCFALIGMFALIIKYLP